MFGVGGLLEVNNQWRLATSIGVMPRAYVELSNQTVMLFPDAYTETTATLIEDTIQDSIVWSVLTGWSPESSGFFVHAGYRLARSAAAPLQHLLSKRLTGTTAQGNQSTGRRQSHFKLMRQRHFTCSLWTWVGNGFSLNWNVSVV